MFYNICLFFIILYSAKARNAQAYIQGSAITGIKYTGEKAGWIFDVNRTSDWDLAVSSPTLFKKAKEIGIKIRPDGTRTGQLNTDQLDDLGLRSLVDKLEQIAGREVHIMLYNSPQAAKTRNKASIYVPRSSDYWGDYYRYGIKTEENFVLKCNLDGEGELLKPKFSNMGALFYVNETERAEQIEEILLSRVKGITKLEQKNYSEN